MNAAQGGIKACGSDAMPEQVPDIADDGDPVAEASSAAQAPSAAAMAINSSYIVGRSPVYSMLQRQRRHASLPVCRRKESPSDRARRLWQQLVERMEAEWALIALSERLARRATPTSLAAAAAVAEAADHAAERRAALTALALKVHALVVASQFTAEAVAQQAAKLTFQQVEQMQSMLDSMQNFALADWVRLNVYNTMNTSVAVPVGWDSGQAPESWRHIDFDQLVYGVGPDASPQQKLHKGSVVFLIQQAEAKAASAGAGQAAGSAAGGAAKAAPAVEAAGKQPAQAPEGAKSEAAAAGSASEGSRLLRWDLSKGSPEQGGAAKQLKKGRPAVAAVPNSRCHGRRPASGARRAAAPESKAGPDRGQALNSAVRQRPHAAARATSSDSAGPLVQPDDASAAADAASPDNAAAIAESAAADALQASAQAISGSSAVPAPPAISESEGAEPASKAVTPRETLVSTVSSSQRQGQAVEEGAGAGWLRGMFAFQRREAERAEPEKPPDWDRFVDRERSWTGLSTGGSFTAQAAAAGLTSGHVPSVPGRGCASPPRWHFWRMPEHLVNPGAKRSRSVKRPQSDTGVLQAAQPQMQPSHGGSQLPSTEADPPAAGQQPPSRHQRSRPSLRQEAGSLAGSGQEQLPDRSLPAVKPGPKLYAVYPMLDPVMLFNPGGPYSEKSARHAALQAALAAQMAAEADRLQTQKSAGASFLPELQAMHQARPLQSSSSSLSVRNTLQAVMRRSMASRSVSPLGFVPPTTHRAASPLSFESQASESIPSLADASAMQGSNSPHDQHAAPATFSRSSHAKTSWAAGPAPPPQASPRRAAIAMHHRKMVAAQAGSAEASKEADVQQQQSGAAPPALNSAAGSMAMTWGRASSSWPSARFAQRQASLAVAGEQGDQAPEGGESAERAEERRRLRHVELTPDELAASGDFQRRLSTTYRATLIRQYHGDGQSDTVVH